MHLSVKMPQNRYKLDIEWERRKKKYTAIVFRTCNGESKIQSTS